ncbi:MAG TPA: ABC transporter permease [Verrucomicrobiae bacterium]|nr:ABC transporter permease [Verrucomicrobiae bacterium]
MKAQTLKNIGAGFLPRAHLLKRERSYQPLRASSEQPPEAAGPRFRSKILVLGFYLLLFTVWQLIFVFHFVPDYIFPSPWQVGKRLWELATDGYLWPSIKATLTRMLIGYMIALGIGIGVGLLMGLSVIANRCMKSLFLGLQTLPTAAWVPISLLIFGLSDKGIFFVIIMSAAPAVAIATSDGILQIPPIYLRAARTLGTPRYAMPLRVVFPAALPSIVTGIKLGWTLGWHGAVSAELIKSSVGLGFLLSMGRELNDAPQVVGIMLLTIAFGLLLDRFLFGLLEAQLRRRRGLTKE